MNFLKSIFGKKKVPIQSYEEFWTWFQQNEKTFYNVVKNKGNVVNVFFKKLSPKLNELKEGYYYLTGMLNDDTVELIITPEGVVKNIVFVEELINAAPQIAGWQFTALKPPTKTIKDLSVQMGEYKFNEENIHFYSNDIIEFPDEIDITIVHDDLTDQNRDVIPNGVFIFLDNYLGEYNLVTTIDNLSIVGKKDASKTLVPIDKLKDFLVWRQKEFIEKYEGVRYNTENDTYSAIEGTLQNGRGLVAIVNTDLLDWDSKASHPWLMNIEIKFNGDQNNGMPDNPTYQLLQNIENEITEELKDFEGYLNIGRQTADNTREIYFACKDFRKPSKIVSQILNKYASNLEFNYEIYKDKYWQTMNRFKHE